MNISCDMSSSKLRITLLADEWKSSRGGLSTINRELAIQLAKHPNVSVTFFVPKCTEYEKEAARTYNISIVEAPELHGYEDPVDWLSFPPRDLAIDVIIGHGVKLGKQAQVIKASHQCTWIQVVHTAPEELSMFKKYPNSDNAISKGDKKQWVEVKLCKIADLVVAVGPKLEELYSGYLRSSGKRVINFTPGIFSEFSTLKLSSEGGKKFRVLVFGRGDSEDFELKGFDIAAKAVAELSDKSYHLVFVGAPSGNETQVADKLLKQGLYRSQLTVKGYLENRDDLATLLSTASLAIIPSRTEGFGLTALEALSAGLPFLVTKNSGFGEALEALEEIPGSTSWIVDSVDPGEWAEAIKDVREKGRKKALEECQELRKRYAEMYGWENQCNALVEMMLSLVKGSSHEMNSAVAASSKNRDNRASNEKLENNLDEEHPVATSKCERRQEVLDQFQMAPLDKNGKLAVKQEEERLEKSPTLGGRGQDDRSMNEPRIRGDIQTKVKQEKKGKGKTNSASSNEERGARRKGVPPFGNGRTDFKEKLQLSRFYIFNCADTDESYAVQKLLQAVGGGHSNVQSYPFTSDEMSTVVTEAIPTLEMDMAFFVVCEHEFQLLINEDDAEIGYAKIYRALMQATGGNIIIVIDGDDNYKDADEENQRVISRWARRKIPSHFYEEFLDGRKSFIFSWNKKHRAIHEEALLHFFDPNKKGQKFQYKPPEHPLSVSNSLPGGPNNQLKNRPKRSICEDQAENRQRGESNRSYSNAVSWSNSTEETRKASSVYHSGATNANTTPFYNNQGDKSKEMLPPTLERPMIRGTASANTQSCYSNQGARPTEVPSPSLPRPNTKLDSTNGKTTLCYSDQAVSPGRKPLPSLERPMARDMTSANTPSLYSNKGPRPTEVPSPSLQRPKAKDSTNGNTTPFYNDQSASPEARPLSSHEIPKAKNTTNANPFAWYSGQAVYSAEIPRLILERPKAKDVTNGNTTPFYSNEGARPTDKPPSSERPKNEELAILGCNAFESSISDVLKAFKDTAPQLTLLESTVIANHHSYDSVKGYLMVNRLRFCVLVVDADDVKNASEQQLDKFQQLLETAADKVAEKVIIFICGSLTQPDEVIVDGTMQHCINNKENILAVWLKNGRLAVDADVLVHFMTPTSAHSENLKALSSSCTGNPGQTQECHTRNSRESGMNIVPHRQSETQQPQAPRAPSMTEETYAGK